MDMTRKVKIYNSAKNLASEVSPDLGRHAPETTKVLLKEEEELHYFFYCMVRLNCYLKHGYWFKVT